MSEIILRRATASDEGNIFEWRNAAETRRYAFNPDAVAWEEHVRWFKDTLARTDRHLLIGELDSKPIGVLRYDVVNEVAEVSIYLVPGCGGRGLGTALLKEGNTWVARHLPQVTTLNARILQENVASRKSFAKAGYVESFGIFKYHIFSGTIIDGPKVKK
ncbi:MAG: GNAT family N-acetyltransferase [Sulfuricella sp.]|nr:GNAT family N-acetyltransferase [Gammaproteobacteria bacterium]